MGSLKEVIEKFRSYDYETLQYFRYGVIAFIVFDMFVVYWLLELKKLGLALLLVSLVFFIFIVLNERGKEPTMKKQTDTSSSESPGDMDEKIKRLQKEKKLLELEKQVHTLKGTNTKNPKKDDEEDDEGFMGLPSSEEYNKRVSEAMGGGVF